MNVEEYVDIQTVNVQLKENYTYPGIYHIVITEKQK